MNRDVNVGFSMHPRWLGDASLADFLKPLRDCGLNALEFELDGSFSDWDQFEPLMAGCLQQGMRLCFHAPYRPLYSLDGFSRGRRAEILAVNRPMWELAERWASRAGEQVAIVVHGAKSETADLEMLREDTRAFLIWVLANFPHLNPALENLDLPKSDEIKFGERHAEVLELVQEIHHPRLGICWDMGHDVRHEITTDPSPDWLRHVIHVHAHDLGESGRDHFPLIYGRVPVLPWLRALKAQGFSGTATLELKGGQLAGWTPAEIARMLCQSIQMVSEGLT